jgi:hypothetical protein
VLYTSVLIQMSHGMAAAMPDHLRSPRAWRRSWLLGFTTAVISRVRAAEQRAASRTANSSSVPGSGVELVLADRNQIIGRTVRRAYPVTRKARVTYTGSGYSDGYAKGTQADLGTSRLSGTGPRPSAAASSAAQSAGAVRWPPGKGAASVAAMGTLPPGTRHPPGPSDQDAPRITPVPNATVPLARLAISAPDPTTTHVGRCALLESLRNRPRAGHRPGAVTVVQPKVGHRHRNINDVLDSASGVRDQGLTEVPGPAPGRPCAPGWSRHRRCQGRSGPGRADLPTIAAEPGTCPNGRCPTRPPACAGDPRQAAVVSTPWCCDVEGPSLSY